MKKIEHFHWCVLEAAKALAPEAYGVPIAERIESDGIYKHVSTGRLYMALTSLETDGLLSTQIGRRKWLKRGGRVRKYFFLTSKGKRFLANYPVSNSILGI